MWANTGGKFGKDLCLPRCNGQTVCYRLQKVMCCILLPLHLH